MIFIKRFVLFLILTELAISGEVEADSITWPLILDVWPHLSRVGSEQCRVQTDILLNKLNHLDLEAAKMYDASAKSATGILNGNINQLGDYNQCVSATVTSSADNNDHVVGQYCMATIHVDTSNNTDPRLAALVDLAQSHLPIRSTRHDDVSVLPTYAEASFGVCVPDCCSRADVESAFNSALRVFNRSLDIYVTVKDGACEVYNPPNYLGVRFLSFMFVIMLVLTTTVCGTVYEISLLSEDGKLRRRQHNVIQRIMLAMSLRKNMAELLDMKTAADEITCIHGIRFIFTLLLYIVHRCLLRSLIPSINRTEITNAFLTSKSSMLLRAFLGLVDTFVILSGLLTSYYGIKTLQSGRKFNILNMYIRKYIKFTPIFMLAIFLTRNVLNEIPRGPQMIRIGKHYVRRCETNIWKSLFYVSNFDGLDKMCYPSTHQLVTDMQLYLIAPFVMMLLWKYKIKFAYYVFGLIVLETSYKGFVLYMNKLSTTIHYGVDFSDAIKASDLTYTTPIHRFPLYAYGILLGYLLRISNDKHFNLSNGLLTGGWLIAVAAAYYTFFGAGAVYSRSYQLNVIASVIFGCLQPIVWTIAVTWTIFVCHKGYGGVLNKILSWKWFIVFTRISYPFYMFSIFIIFWNVASIQETPFIHYLNIVDLNELAFILLFSVVGTLTFLLPTKDVYKILTGKGDELQTDKQRDKEE